MNAFNRCAIAGCFLLLLPALAQAQLNLVFSGGNVSIDADAVPLRAILDAWATLGGTRIDGIDKLPQVDITLHVASMAEDEALAALLEGRGAFATVPRKPGEAGSSRIARIAVFSAAPNPAAGAPRSTVPVDWPFPVNEHPDDKDRQPPTSEIIVERPGIEVPWPFPVNEIIMDTPAVGVEERPGIDVPWPFPVNLQPTLELEPPTTEIKVERPGIDVPWPFPVNPNPVDPDAPAPVVEPAAETPRDPSGSDQTAAEPPATAKTPTTKTEGPAAPKPGAKAGAPVSTKAPKPTSPRKRP